jgi:hypothetical protein
MPCGAIAWFGAAAPIVASITSACDTRANSIITGKKSAAYALVAVRLGGKWICRYVLAAARDVSLHDNIRAFAEIINAPIHL